MLVVIKGESDTIAINLDNIESVSNSADGFIKFYCNDDIHPINIYKPDNKRNKIFMDLISAYANNEKVFFMPDEKENRNG